MNDSWNMPRLSSSSSLWLLLFQFLCFSLQGVDGETGGGRMILYLESWMPCPTEDTPWDKYSHVLVSFAHSYEFNAEKNICSQKCIIKAPPVCNNEPNPELLRKWKAQGKKVLLSFGGAGMGGSWDGHNDCWEYCYGREDQVVEQLTEIITDMDLDGIDIDYEYYHEDNMWNSGWYRGQEAQDFLVGITEGLRNSLKPDAIITHVPMNPDVVPGSGYWKVFERAGWALDFLMPQYYNGFVYTVEDQINHMTTIANGLFGGDMSMVVSGFCANDCFEFNRNGYQTAQTLTFLQQQFVCHGGIFLWSSKDDMEGDWSAPVSDAMDSMECRMEIIPPPSLPPTEPPTAAPTDPSEASAAAPVTWAPLKIFRLLSLAWETMGTGVLGHITPRLVLFNADNL